MTTKLKLLVLLPLVLLATTSCEDKEADALAKAQKCLNEVPQSAPTTASNCMDFIAGYDSQQAKILKCSIVITSGGLMEDRIVDAFEILENDDIPDAQKDAALMVALTLDRPTLTGIGGGFEKAQQGDALCRQTGVPGLMYLSGLVLAGTSMAKLLADLGQTIDLTDPSSADPDSIESAFNELINRCAPVGADPAGADDTTCDNTLPTLGAAVQNLAANYCNAENADEGSCTEIDAAVEAAGGDTAKIGRAALCYLNGKKYNATTDQCINP